jgi:hypothetical protein
MKLVDIFRAIFKFIQTKPSKTEVKDTAVEVVSDVIKKDDPLVAAGVAIVGEVVSKEIEKRVNR